MLVDLKTIVDQAANAEYAVPAFNVFGFEDAISVIQAAEQMKAPIILAANLPAIGHMPFEFIAPLLLEAGRQASVPVCVHLDHGKDYAYIEKSIKYGFTSVMFDGSQLPLNENIRQTCKIVELAKKSGVSVEAEIGSVGYSDPSIRMKHEFSDPREVEVFVERTGIDAVAVSVGTVHRMETQSASIRFDLLEQIQQRVGIPLVIHGSTGVPDSALRRLAKTRVGKINIGTALRMAFGNALRDEMGEKPNVFDRIALFRRPMEAVREAALLKYNNLGFGKGAT